VALKSLAENAGGNRPATSKAKLRDPDPLDGKDLLEPVRAGSLGPNWTEAWVVGLWLQLMCCARSVIQPWISETDIGRRLELRDADEETRGYSS
jgi:hypothetical protein